MTLRAASLRATLIFTVLAICAIAAPAFAQALTPEQEATLQRANSSLNEMQQITGNFVQVGPDGSRTEGTLYLERPGKLRFEYDAPSNLQIISDGFWVAIQDRKLKTTEQYPLATTPLKLILAKEVDLARDAFIRDIHTQEGFVTVTLQERAGEAEGSLILIFDSETFDLRQWTVTDAQGYDTSIALSDLANAGPFERKTFRINELGTIKVQRGN